jgi:hypothetical protein
VSIRSLGTLARRGAGRAVACALAAATAGCGINCDRNPDVPPVDYKEGITRTKPELTYESTSWEGPWLAFPPGRTYRFYHQLGGIPISIETWVAFSDRCGDHPGGVERSSEGAGNQTTIEQPNDPRYFDVRNDTCSDVCLRVAASHPILDSEPPPEQPETDGGNVPTPGDGG